MAMAVPSEIASNERHFYNVFVKHLPTILKAGVKSRLKRAAQLV